MRHVYRCILACCIAAATGHAFAEDQNVFAFGGRYTNQYFEYTFNPFTVGYEDNYVLGAGYQQFALRHDGGLKLGVELGAALRLGNQTSGELWVGPVLRADGIIQTEQVKVSASVTAGLSVTTDTIGIERAREIEMGGDSTLLYYLGPEVSVSFANNPDVEYFARVHHRSGGWESLGNMRDGANAASVGVRWSL